MKNKKILYISNSSEIGGGNRSLLTILDNIQSANISPTVFLPGKGRFLKELQQRNISSKIITHSFSENAGHIQNAFHILMYLYEIIKISPDLIHSNDLFCFKMASYAQKILKIPTICHIRYSIETEAVKYFFNIDPKLIIFNSQYMLNMFKEKNSLFNENVPLKVIYNGFESNEYFLPHLRVPTRIGWGYDDEYLVGIIGNLQKVKGHELFLHSAKKLSEKFHNIRFIVIGEDVLEGGKRKADLKQLAKELGIKNLVKFTGFEKNVGKALSALDCLVVPSNYEPFGRVAVEGLLAGLPVIGCSTGGLVEILNENPLGFLLKENSISELARVLENYPLKKHSDSSEIIKAIGMANSKFGVRENIKLLIEQYTLISFSSQKTK